MESGEKTESDELRISILKFFLGMARSAFFETNFLPVTSYLLKLYETLLNYSKYIFEKLFMQYYADILLSQTFRSVKYKTENDKKYFELFSFILFISK